MWLDYLLECKIMSGETIFIETEESEISDFELLGKLKQKADTVVIEKPIVEKKKRVYSENEEDIDDETEEDENGNLIRMEENLLLDDEFDDTFIEMPDEYVIDDVQTEQPKPLLEVKEEEPHDDWGF
jgi:hypothetical protein